MPPTFAYIMGLMCYLLLAGTLMMVFLICLVIPSARRTGYRGILSVLATFPGMIIHQMLSFPVTVLIILVGAGVAYLLDVEHHQMFFWVVIPILFASILWFALASAYGIYVGARIAWRLTENSSFQDALREHYSTRALLALFWLIRK